MWLGEGRRYRWDDDIRASRARNQWSSHRVGRYRDTLHHSTIPRHVAAKRYPPGDEGAHAERRLLRSLDHNVYVLRLHDAGYVSVEDESVWVLTPWMSGGSLSEVLEDSGALPPGRVNELFTELLGGVGRVHREKIALGDVACENLFLTAPGDNGYLVIADLDHAKPADSLEATGRPAYRPPAECRADAADAYALGVVLWEMLTGRRAFELLDARCRSRPSEETCRP